MVITTFKIGPVLTDTIHSMLDQQDVDIAGLALVIDGCPYVESTLAICRRYARAFEGLFHYIWLDNGGVSRARNRGVKWLMERFPDIEGVFMLDGDDLLTPNSASTSLEYLIHAGTDPDGRHPGWIYMDQVQFGHNAAALRYPRKFYPTRWLGSNLTQPSCLISRDMFEAGIFWDEDMRQGVEDWEYWYSAIHQGFAGINNPNAYLKYRRLTGNRSSLNRSKDGLTKDYMRRKHADMMTVRQFFHNEQRHFPRWAFALPGSDWRLTSDPEIEGEIVGWARFVDAISYRFAQPDHRAYIFDPYFPDLVASIDPADEAVLKATGLLAGVLFEAEFALRHHPICLVDVRAEVDSDEAPRPGMRVETVNIEQTGEDYDTASFLLCLRNLANLFEGEIKAANAERGKEDIPSPAELVADRLGLRRQIRRIIVAVPGEILRRHRLEASGNNCFERVCDFTRSFLEVTFLPLAPSKLLRPHHTHCGCDKANHGGLGTELFGHWPIMPLVRTATAKDIALVLADEPTTDFARCCRELLLLKDECEFRLHIVSLGREVAAYLGEIEPFVRSRHALDLDAHVWTPRGSVNYFGVPLYDSVGQFHHRHGRRHELRRPRRVGPYAHAQDGRGGDNFGL